MPLDLRNPNYNCCETLLSKCFSHDWHNEKLLLQRTCTGLFANTLGCDLFGQLKYSSQNQYNLHHNHTCTTGQTHTPDTVNLTTGEGSSQQCKRMPPYFLFPMKCRANFSRLDRLL